MTYDDFLARVIDDGIEAARRSYASKPAQLRGAVAGFEACRGKTPIELKVLLERACIATHNAHVEIAADGKLCNDDYWEVRCYAAEVEWVCNCVSAILMNQGEPTIVAPTARGVIKADEVIKRQSSALH